MVFSRLDIREFLKLDDEYIGSLLYFFDFYVCLKIIFLRKKEKSIFYYRTANGSSSWYNHMEARGITWQYVV